mgnify:CR=1 FL=1
MLLRILHGGGKQRCDQRHNGDDINAHPSCRSADDCARMRRNGRITVLLLKIPAVKGHAVVNAQCNAPDAHAQGQQQDRGDPHEKRLRRLCGPAAVAGQLHTQLSKKGKAHAQHGQQPQPIGQICACKPFVTAAVKLMERPQKECRRIEAASSARSDVCKFPCVIGRNDPAQPGAGWEHAVDTALRFLRGIPLYRRAVCALRRICGLHRPRLLILDEPTTGLDPQTRSLLWQVVAGLRQEENLTVFLTTHYMEEAADAGYVVLLDHGRIAAEGTPLQLKNTYAHDTLTLYGVGEADVRRLGLPYAPAEQGWRVTVPDPAAAAELIRREPALFRDFELTKGRMDDVFLAVTGKKLAGGAEK